MNFDAWRHNLRAGLWRLLRRPDAAIAGYRAALAADPHHASAASALAFLLAARGADSEALVLLERATQLNPRDALAWFNLGYLRERRHQTVAAEQAFRHALEHDCKLDPAWYGLGRLLAQRGDYRAAIDAYEQAAQRQPMNAQVWYALGMAWHGLHDPEKVQAVVEHLNRFDPRMTRRLILDTGRSDLAHLVADLQVD